MPFEYLTRLFEQGGFPVTLSLGAPRHRPEIGGYTTKGNIQVSCKVGETRRHTATHATLRRCSSYSYARGTTQLFSALLYSTFVSQ